MSKKVYYSYCKLQDTKCKTLQIEIFSLRYYIVSCTIGASLCLFFLSLSLIYTLALQAQYVQKVL